MTFQARLKKVMREGNLRVADLARWFDRRHSTIRGWVIDGRTPAGTIIDVKEIIDLTARLEDRTATHGKYTRSYIKTVRQVDA